MKCARLTDVSGLHLYKVRTEPYKPTIDLKMVKDRCNSLFHFALE